MSDRLFRINNLDPVFAEWRDLVRKFGTPEFYEQFQRAVQRTDLKFPDWSAMEQRSNLPVRDALELNEKYVECFANLRKPVVRPREPKCGVIFEL